MPSWLRLVPTHAARRADSVETPRRSSVRSVTGSVARLEPVDSAVASASPASAKKRATGTRARRKSSEYQPSTCSARPSATSITNTPSAAVHLVPLAAFGILAKVVGTSGFQVFAALGVNTWKPDV